MKKYTMLSALWLFACGAGAGQGPQDDSTLRSSLTANDDDGDGDATELPSTGHTGSTEGSAGSDTSDCDEPGGTFPAGPGSAAPGAVPDMVIGAGGTAWDPQQNASVVWCNIDVPIGCPAISPVPEGGRLVVVHGMTEAGGAEMGTAGSGSGAAGSGNAGEVSTSADDPVINAGGSFVVYASPDTAGGGPSTEVPVIIGGSLPPLPGTCVAVTFPMAGVEPIFVTPGAPNAGGESDPVTPTAPNAGGESDPVTPTAPNAGGESDTVTPTAPNAGGESATVTPTAPNAGGMPAFPGTLPALPPPGGCLGVTFPVGAPGYPAVPGQVGSGGNVAPLPAEPAAGACVNVGFATSADPNQPRPSHGPVMCAFPGIAPVSGGAAAPSAGNEAAQNEDLY